MAPDAVDEDDMDEAAKMDGSGPKRQADPDASYRKDPKKALRHYLESKGYSCEFEVEESGPGHAREYTARIRLPIETSMGPIYGEATTGRRKDAEREAALDACIQLDTRGMLGNNNKGSSEGKKAGAWKRRLLDGLICIQRIIPHFVVLQNSRVLYISPPILRILVPLKGAEG